jgi:hypothetical protein
MKKYVLPVFLLALLSCGSRVQENNNNQNPASRFEEDVEFLKKYSPVIELSDQRKKSKVAVMPALQGRVMTSTSDGIESYGWINRSLFESGDTSAHINAFGGEERFWLGPEGGQYSIFFEKGAPFDLENWHTPRLIDLEPYELISETANSAKFTKSSQLKNYSGTVFDIGIEREIKVLEQDEIFALLGQEPDTSLQSVAYQTINAVENKGTVAWSKKSGLLSIWLLGMFNPSPDMTVIIPYNSGPEGQLGAIVNDDYFGKVPAERLKVTNSVIYFKGDGTYRSKIGLSPARAKDILASYDAATKTLTVVKFTKPEGSNDYVNSKWEIQTEPFKGDVVNSYNDGPPTRDAKPLGPFYELESSSPAKELKPGERIVHTQTTIHLQGNEAAIDKLTRSVLGVSVEEIKGAF